MNQFFYPNYSNSYSQLLGNSLAVGETKYPYDYLTERHLQVMWLEQKYFKNLKSIDGQIIEVISPGIWNAEAGPDFLKAHLRINGREIKGSVEIHLSDEGWVNHRHHLDPNYNNVVLHLSLWKPKVTKQLETQSGNLFFKAYLEDFLTISHARILQLIDLDLYPYQRFVGTGTCAAKLYHSLPKEKIHYLFRSAADWRLSQKTNYLKAHSDSDLHFGVGIAMALGYKNNAESFFELFIRLIKLKHLPENEMLSLGMGMCGFFGPKFQKKWGKSDRYKLLRELFDLSSSKVSDVIPLALHKIRPLNHPIRRLVYLVKLLKDPILIHLFSYLKNCWDQKNSQKKWPQLRQELIDLLPTYSDDYWNDHFLYEIEPAKEYLPLVGENLKLEIIVNVFLPLIHENIMMGGNREEIERFHEFYGSIPATKSRKLKYLIHRFFGDNKKASIFNRADMEQGAFQIHRDFCCHYEASCEGCPFTERYNALFS